MDEALAAEAVPDGLRADAHHWMAHCYRDTGRLEAADVFVLEAITFEECAGRAVILANHRIFLAQLLEGRGGGSASRWCRQSWRSMLCAQRWGGTRRDEVQSIGRGEAAAERR
ncbi:hypothetical protein WMF30_51425 [Sorangium sp. So ce134]